LTTYYVNGNSGAGGSDSNDGLAVTLGGGHGPWLTIDHAATVAAAGDITNIVAIAGNATTWPTSGFDYLVGGGTSFLSPANGDTSSGYITWQGYGGIPTIASNGLIWYNASYQQLINLSFTATGTSNAYAGMINGGTYRLSGCLINNNGYDISGLRSNNVSTIAGSVFYGGSTSPAGGASAELLVLGGGNTNRVVGSAFVFGRYAGIYMAGYSLTLSNCLIAGNLGTGATLAPTSDIGVQVLSCTFDGNGADALDLVVTAGDDPATVLNNIFSNNASGYGLSFNNASPINSGPNVDYNNFYNNLTNRNNVSAGPNDLTANPTYAGASGGIGSRDWTPTNTALKSALATVFAGTGTSSYGYRGAVQPNSGGGGTTTYVINQTINRYVHEESY
jgi:hypothetical protein